MFEYEVIKELIGKTLIEVTRSGDEEILFRVSDSESYRMYHEQDCCESVTIEDVCGELEWLIGSPILRAERRTQNTTKEDREWGDDGATWTFYEFATLKGAVTIRWYGSSNGYYSEFAHFRCVETGRLA